MSKKEMPSVPGAESGSSQVRPGISATTTPTAASTPARSTAAVIEQPKPTASNASNGPDVDQGTGDPVIGSQRPRICSVPDYASSSGDDAVELAAMAGLILDPWQQYVLRNSLGERADGKWAAFEVGLVVPRQNGKGGILEARELAGLFLLGERFIVHSAHQFDTAIEAFRRLLDLVDGSPDLSRRVKRVSRSHGDEGIELVGGQRIRFRTRTKGGGRGFTGDCLLLDEAMDLPEEVHGALLPTLSARPNPQVWYCASAVDQDVEDHGMVLARIRERGMAGEDPSLAYFEWSADLDIDKLVPADLDSVDHYAQANPALGIRITERHIRNEALSLDPRTFAVERLGVGDWPRIDSEAKHIIDMDRWHECTDLDSAPLDPVCFAFDVTPDRSTACVAVSGLRSDGLPHIEVIEHKRGTRWVVATVARLAKQHHRSIVVCDAYGPAGSLLTELENLGIEVLVTSAGDQAQACGIFYDAVMDSKTLRHLDTPELTAAVDGATTRQLGESWAWSRKKSTVDISPLVAATLALWGSSQRPARPTPRIVSLESI